MWHLTAPSGTVRTARYGINCPPPPLLHNVGDQGPRKNSGSHIDASHSRQPLVKGERLVRYEVNAVMSNSVPQGGWHLGRMSWLVSCSGAIKHLIHDPEETASWGRLLEEARKLTSSREILLWMTPSEAPKALQASECSELLDPMRASCWIFAQH